MNTETLVPIHLHDALRTRLEANSRLSNRRTYIGASEVGGCLRRIVASKLSPEPFDAPSMGRMLAGRALENEVVQLVRVALNGRLRNTGRNQLEVQDSELSFRAHPDGRIIGDANDGDGVLEVKTASAAAFKRYQNEGLPQNYLDQVQSQMGLAGLRWGLVVLVSRENLAELATFPVRFDPDRYAELRGRAQAWEAAMGGGDLPDGEPDRGYCFNCPYAHDCPQHLAQRQLVAEGELPEITRLELEAHVEELGGLEAALDPLQQRSVELRERIKATLEGLGCGRASLDGALVQIVASSRTSFDAKAFQREAPDLYPRFLKTSTFSTLRVTFRGDHS